MAKHRLASPNAAATKCLPWHSYDGVSNKISYISNHSWSHSGNFYPPTASIKLSGQVWLLPEVVLDIDGLGGPSLGVKPFLEVAMDLTNANECAAGSATDVLAPWSVASTAQAAPATPAATRAATAMPSRGQLRASGALQGGVSGAGDSIDIPFFAAVNWGLQVSLSAELQVAALGKVYWSHQFPAWTLLSVKKPVMSGCWKLGTSNAANRNVVAPQSSGPAGGSAPASLLYVQDPDWLARKITTATQLLDGKPRSPLHTALQARSALLLPTLACLLLPLLARQFTPAKYGLGGR